MGCEHFPPGLVWENSLDRIARYTPMRQSLLALYQALDFQPVRKSEPALQKATNAEYNAKYFGVGQGTNIYVHAADIWMPLGKLKRLRPTNPGDASGSAIAWPLGAEVVEADFGMPLPFHRSPVPAGTPATVSRV